MNSEIMHPTTELLTNYMESPTASEFSDVRKHLLNCKGCRSEINRLTYFTANLIKEIPHFRNNQIDWEPHLLQSHQNADIEAYVDGAPTVANEQSISELLQNNKIALKSALHYALHDAAMAPALVSTMNATMTATTDPIMTAPSKQQPESLNTRQPQVIDGGIGRGKSTKHTKIHHALVRLLEWRPSAWLSIPTTAVAVLALSVLLLPQLQSSSPHNSMLATYQDRQLTRYKPSSTPTPGIGFFNNASVSHQTFNDIRIRYAQNALHVNWQAVNNAQQYTFSLYKNTTEQKSLITTVHSATNSTVVAKLNLQPAQHYVWELRGKTTDQSVFSVNGGFIIGK